MKMMLRVRPKTTDGVSKWKYFFAYHALCAVYIILKITGALAVHRNLGLFSLCEALSRYLTKCGKNVFAVK